MFRKETFSLTVSTDFEARECNTVQLSSATLRATVDGYKRVGQIFGKRATPNLPSSRVSGAEWQWSGVKWSGGEARKLAQTFESGERPKLHRSMEFDLITEGS